MRVLDPLPGGPGQRDEAVLTAMDAREPPGLADQPSAGGVRVPGLLSSCLASLRRDQEGIASGANDAIGELGGVFGIAILGAVFSAHGYSSGPAFVSGLWSAAPHGTRERCGGRAPGRAGAGLLARAGAGRLARAGTGRLTGPT
jgi:hypothetical protein